MSEVTVSLVENCAKNVRHNTPKGDRHAGHDAARAAMRPAIDGFESRSSNTLRLHGSNELPSPVFHILLGREGCEDRVE